MGGRGCWLSAVYSFDQEILTEQLLCARYSKNCGYFYKQKATSLSTKKKKRKKKDNNKKT